MRLREYLPQIQHAVEIVAANLHREHDLERGLRESVARLTAATQAGYSRVDSITQLSGQLDELDDDPLLATAIYWDTYFGVDKDRYYADAELQKVTNALIAKEVSLSALAGSLLQYAKQGISLQYGRDKKGCPVGRAIGTQSISDVIWQARNQALHWEDGKFSDAVENCFSKLAAEVGQNFGSFRDRNLAYDIVVAFGWRGYDDMERDLLALDP